MQPTSFVIRQSTRDLTAMSGMALVGVALNRFAEVARRIDPKFPVRQGLPSSQILASYIGLLTEGKSDFEAIESKRGDGFFQQAPGIAGVPSAATLRQRMDALGVPGSEAVDARWSRCSSAGTHSSRRPPAATFRSIWMCARPARSGPDQTDTIRAMIRAPDDRIPRQITGSAWHRASHAE